MSNSKEHVELIPMQPSISENIIPLLLSNAVRVWSAYLITAIPLYFLFYIWRPSSLSRSRLRPVQAPQRPLKEAFLSLANMTLLAIPMALAAVYGPDPASNALSPWIDTTGWVYSTFAVVLVFLIVDAEFFWVHWAFHRFHSKAHAVHHQFTDPTPFAGWSFHLWESLAYTLPYFPIVLFLPLPPACGFAILYGTVIWNAYLHLGYDPLPESARRHFLGRWFHTARTHCGHHHNPRYTFSLYFTFWDKWMGTEAP